MFRDLMPRTVSRSILPLLGAAAVPWLIAASQPAAAAEGPRVLVINDGSSPVPTRNVDNAPNQPFAKLLCLADIATACDAFGARPALPSKFTVPTATAGGLPVKRLVIESVSGTCVGLGRSTFVEISNTPTGGAHVNPDTGDNFSTNRFPLAVAQFLQAPGINGAQAYSQATRMYFEPGSTVQMSFDVVAAGGLACRAQLNGYLAVR